MKNNKSIINSSSSTTQLLKVFFYLSLDYGELRKINKRIPISDSEGEIITSVRLFLFDNHLVA